MIKIGYKGDSTCMDIILYKKDREWCKWRAMVRRQMSELNEVITRASLMLDAQQLRIEKLSHVLVSICGIVNADLEAAVAIDQIRHVILAGELHSHQE
jgi:hypothetical protein